MSKESQIIDTKSLYVNPDRGVATLNYSQNYFTDIPSLINSDEVRLPLTTISDELKLELDKIL